MAIVFDSDAGTITGLSVGGLPDGTVDAGTLASNAVTEAKIATDAVTAAKIATDAVTAAKIPDTVEAGFKSGRKNLIINGSFDVWQRGTSITSSGAYNADRWHSSHGASLTTSRQTFTVGQTDVPNNPKYYQRTDGTGLASNQSFEIRQHIEGVETAANQQVTLSFYAKSSVSATHKTAFWQRFDNWSDYQTGIGDSNFTTTTSWQRFTRTFTLADISGETVVAGANTLTFVIDGEAGFTGTFDLAQVQLELGSTATDFEHRSYGEELALCQRYFQRISGGGDAFVVARSEERRVGKDATIPLNVPLRASPTMNSINARAFYDNSSFVSSTGAPTANSYVDGNILLAIQHGGFSGLTNNKIYNWGPLSSAIEIDAEL